MIIHNVTFSSEDESGRAGGGDLGSVGLQPGAARHGHDPIA